MDNEEKSDGKRLARRKPQLISIGDRKVTDDGRYHDALAMAWLMEFALQTWVPMGEFARAMTGSNTVNTKRRVRARLRNLRRICQSQGLVLLINFGEGNAHPNAASSLKIFNPESPEDTSVAIRSLQKAEQLGDIRSKEALELRHLIEQLTCSVAA